MSRNYELRRKARKSVRRTMARLEKGLPQLRWDAARIARFFPSFTEIIISSDLLEGSGRD